MTVYIDAQRRLADRTEAEIVALFARYERGQLEREQFIALAAALLARGRANGIALGDLSLTAEVIRALRKPTSPVGITLPENDVSRLQVSVATILALDVASAVTAEARSASVAARLARLARDSTAEASVWGKTQAALARGMAGGWVRVTDPDPCVLCQGWADGKVRPWSMTMVRHTNCQCAQASVFFN